MKKVLALILSLTMIGSFVLAGCGGDKGGDDNKDGIKNIVLIVGSLGDKSFSDIAWEGVQKFGKDFDIPVKCLEYGTDKTKLNPMLLDASDNYDVVISASNEILEYLEKGVAEQYPDNYYVCFDIAPSYKVVNDNVFCINYKQFEGDYLAAYIAMKMSKSGVIGFVGGEEATVILDFMTGYIDGALAANANGKVAVSFVGNYSDTAKAKELSLTQASQGADVIHQVAGGAGLGIFEAMADKNGLAIGVDADQRNYFTESNPELADIIFTSMMKRNDIAIYSILEQTVKGTASYGTLQRWGAAEGVTVLVDNDYFAQTIGKDLHAEYTKLLTSLPKDIHSAYYMESSEINNLRNSVKP